MMYYIKDWWRKTISSFMEDLGNMEIFDSFNGLEVNATFAIGCDDDEWVDMPTLHMEEIKEGVKFILFARVAVARKQSCQ